MASRQLIAATAAAPYIGLWDATLVADGNKLTATSAGSPIEIPMKYVMSADALVLSCGTVGSTGTTVDWVLMVSDPTATGAADEWGPIRWARYARSYLIPTTFVSAKNDGTAGIGFHHCGANGFGNAIGQTGTPPVLFDLRGVPFRGTSRIFVGVIAYGAVSNALLFDLCPIQNRPL